MINANYCIDQYGPIDIVHIDSMKPDFAQGILELDIKDAFLQFETIISTPYRPHLQYPIFRNSNMKYTDEDGSLSVLNEEYQSWLNEKSEKVNSSIYVYTKQHNFLYSKDNYDPQYGNTPTLNQLLKEAMPFKYETGTWTCLHTTDPAVEPGLITPSFLEKYADKILLVTEYKLEQSTNIQILDNLLEKYLGADVLIPYSIEERRKKYPLAFQELARYMKNYE